jgi:hypothetical protein
MNRTVSGFLHQIAVGVLRPRDAPVPPPMRYFRPGGAETPAKGYGILRIGKELGIGTSAVQRVIGQS